MRNNWGAVFNKSKLKAEQKAGNVKFFRNSKGTKRKATGKLWITWMKGYADYKRQMRGSSEVNLIGSKDMVNSFTVLDVQESPEKGILKTNFGDINIGIPKETYMKFGWLDPLQAKKAHWNRTRKNAKRDMLGLPTGKIKEILDPYLK